MSSEPRLLLRADASAALGTGHAMRLLAVAQAWHDETGGATRLLAAEPLPEALARRLSAEGIELGQVEGAPAPGGRADAAAVAAAAHDGGFAGVVIDHYGFGPDALEALGDAGLRVLCFDDFAHRKRLTASWVVNPNLHARPELYPDLPPERLLLGPRYAPLRREFVRMPPPARDAKARPTRLLVTLGGSDPHGVTRPVVEGIGRLDRDDLHTSVVVGGSHPDARVLLDWLGGLGPRVTPRTDVADMAGCMAEHDLAVSAGGTTTHELMRAGLPSLVVAVAENQQAAVAAMHEAGLAESLGWREQLDAARVEARLAALLSDPARRARMAERCRQLQDGGGAGRLVAALAHGLPLSLRRVGPEDCRTLFDWANDAGTRAASFRPDPIEWSTHVAWLERALADPRRALWLGSVDDDPIGCVRFEADEAGDGRAVVSVTVAPAWRGRGAGRALIAMGTRRMHDAGWCREIHALIRPDNAASLRAFEAAGYRLRGHETAFGEPAVRYVARPGEPA